MTGSAGAEVHIKGVSLEDLTTREARRPDTTSPKFRKLKLTDLFYSEGAAIGDLNRDGVPDLVAGAFYYLGPEYTLAREIWASRTFNPTNNSDTFMQFLSSTSTATVGHRRAVRSG